MITEACANNTAPARAKHNFPFFFINICVSKGNLNIVIVAENLKNVNDISGNGIDKTGNLIYTIK